MGRPLSWRVWRKRAVPAAYVGSYADPAGMTACVFADPRSGRALGPMNLRLGERSGGTAPAPRVGAPPESSPGRLGLLEHYAVEWEGRQKGPDRETRGVFLRFEESSESCDLAALAVDGLLLGLLGDAAKLDALQEPADLDRAVWGLILSRRLPEARRLLPRLAAPGAVGALLDLLEGRAPALPASLPGWELAPPGLLQPLAVPRVEGGVEPDAGPFAEGPADPLRFLRAAGVDSWRAALRALDGAREIPEAIALGVDARGRLGAVVEGRVDRLRWCSPESVQRLRFGEVLRLQLQGDRVGWAESLGRHEKAKAVDFLRGTKESAWLAAAAAWDAWKAPEDAAGIREAVATQPSAEHARRLEAQLPGRGTSQERIAALLTLVAAYWRAGAFEDAWILLGRMPSILPETQDAPVHRAARMLHGMLEGRHVHEASEEDRNELGYVWDGTLASLVEDLGPALAGRCAEVFEAAGL